jgi:chemotaxis protein CheD
MQPTVVRMADCQIAATPGMVLAAYALGSCIGLAIHDPQTCVGGLLHFMLPDSQIDPAMGQANPYKFADTGIPKFIDELIGLGASKNRLTVHVVGGAHMMRTEGLFEIGKRNYLAARRILWRAGLLVHGEAVGGDQSRTVRLEIGPGRVWLLEGGTERELSSTFGRKGGAEWPIVS